MKQFFAKYEIPENSPPNHKYLTQAAVFYRRQLLAMYDGRDISAEQPDTETGITLIDMPGPEPAPAQSGGWFSSAKSLFNSATSYASEYANELYDRTSEYVAASPTVSYVESTLVSNITAVSEKMESVINPLWYGETNQEVELEDMPA